jgi:hypothetical protein
VSPSVNRVVASDASGGGVGLGNNEKISLSKFSKRDRI